MVTPAGNTLLQGLGVTFSQENKSARSYKWRCQCYIYYETILRLSSILTLTFKQTGSWNPSFVNNYSNRCSIFDVQSVVFLINNFTANHVGECQWWSMQPRWAFNGLITRISNQPLMWNLFFFTLLSLWKKLCTLRLRSKFMWVQWSGQKKNILNFLTISRILSTVACF